MDNEEIVRRLVDAHAIDFAALGKVFGELGPALTATDGLRGVLFGRPSIIACLMPAGPEGAAVVGELRNLANLGATLTEG
jgi:hypothetical protein